MWLETKSKVKNGERKQGAQQLIPAATGSHRRVAYQVCILSSFSSPPPVEVEFEGER
jgi:hypothetical protein